MLPVLTVAAQVLAKTLAGANLTQALATAIAGSSLAAGERGAVRDICYQGLRHLGLIDAQLKRLLIAPVRHPEVKGLLIAALAALQFTRAKPFVIVNFAVESTERLGMPAAKSLVNAVLRNFLRKRADLEVELAKDEEAQYNFPYWWLARVKRQFPDTWQTLITAQNLHPPLTIRVNRRKANVGTVTTALVAAGFTAQQIGEDALLVEPPKPVAELPHFADGWFSVQDAGAQLAAVLLDCKDGMRVLDACAAPGGKTCHILERSNVDLIAIDNDAARLARIRENLTRLQLQATVLEGDAAKPDTWWDKHPFDRILLDVPCSASGTARRNPDIRWTRRETDIAQFAKEQVRLLKAAWPLLKPGGRLLYATCSIFREENRDQIARFLAQEKTAREIPLQHAALKDGVLAPDATHDGFFYALLEKHA